MKLAIVDCRMPDAAKNKLSMLGCYVIELMPDARLSEPIASHPDMILFHHKRTVITSSEYCERYPYVFEDISRLVPGLRLIFTEDAISSSYPSDARFNALALGRRLFCRKESISAAILDYAKSAELSVVPTKQGYPACTTLALSENAAISADRGMLHALRSEGVTAYEIENGDISLPPYEYGFIGGAAGLTDGKLLFIGDPEHHPSYKTIKQAADEEGLKIISLYDGELLDLGRIIFIDGDVK